MAEKKLARSGKMMFGDALKPVFEKYKGQISFAYLFGSVADGSESALSDVDLAIYVSDPEGFSMNDKLMFHGDCCRSLKRNDIDIVVLNQTKNLMLLDQITRTGKVLWETDSDERMMFELKVQHMGIDFKFQRRKEMEV